MLSRLGWRRSIRIGKILIQRDETTHLPKVALWFGAAASTTLERGLTEWVRVQLVPGVPQLFYAKLPPDIANRYCLLLDPMLGARRGRGCASSVQPGGDG